MLTKLFIVAFAIIGIAVRPSVGQTAKQVMDDAYDDTVGGAVSLKFTLWRAANCPSEGTINRGTTKIGRIRYCYFCICGVTTPPTTVSTPNCDFVSCPTTGADAVSAAKIATWKSTTTPNPSKWKSIREAEPLQVYSVDDGFCYATNIDTNTGRTMKCFAHR